MLKKLVLSSALLALVVSLTTFGFAQGSAESSVTGSISAYVTDPSGATISDAKVTLTGATGEKVINTGGDGKVLFQVLPPGAYSLKVEKTGFKTADVKGVEVVIEGRALGPMLDHLLAGKVKRVSCAHDGTCEVARIRLTEIQ